MTKVLVISVHPDDETVGCAGSLIKHREAGDAVTWLVMTQAVQPQWSADLIARKAREVELVAGRLGIERVLKAGLTTTRLDTIAQSDIMAPIREAVDLARPDWVYLVNRSDIHSDHRAVFEAALAVMKPFHQGASVRRILCYETLSSTEAAPALAERAFVPNAYSNITAHIDEKLQLMELYKTEIQPYPQPRALETIRALGRYRGATVGVGYAEAFMILRELF